MLVQPNLLLRRRIRRWLDRLTLWSIIFVTCCLVYSLKVEPNWIEVVPIQLSIPSLDRAFDGFKIVQISDLHATKYMPAERLEKVVRLVNQQHPDAIAITGDIITKNSRFDRERLGAILSQLQSESLTLAVLGNHDHWHEELEGLKQTLFDSGVVNLDNQVRLVERQGKQLAFAGIDDPYWGEPDLAGAISRLPSGVPAVLLVHEPDYVETSSQTYRFALQLSGHSHGGQIKLPFLNPLVLPRGGRKYFAGLNRVADTWAYTNRGLGMTNLPLRFGSRPEITVFTLSGGS